MPSLLRSLVLMAPPSPPQMDLSGIKDDESTMRMLYNEINGMKALDHPNIVRLQEVNLIPYSFNDSTQAACCLDCCLDGVDIFGVGGTAIQE